MLKLRCPVIINHIHLKRVVLTWYHTISFLWQMFFQIGRKFIILTSLCSSLLQQHIDLNEFVPASFRKWFYTSTSRSFPLILLVFLHYSRHLREFCGFNKVPDASKITRFKQPPPWTSYPFGHLVDLSEPVCQAIVPSKADMVIFCCCPIRAPGLTPSRLSHQWRI